MANALRFQRPNLELERDNAIVEHVLRDCLTTVEATHTRFFADSTFDACTKVLKRLVRQKILREYPLVRNKSYFRLGSRALSNWGYPRRRGDSIGPLRLPYELGCLTYTSEHEKRLLADELLEKLPSFPDELLFKWAYVWDGKKLGTIRVEFRESAEATVHKLGKQLFNYRQFPDVQALIDSKRFFFAVVTASDPQSIALHQEAVEQNLGVELRTIDDPSLVRFI